MDLRWTPLVVALIGTTGATCQQQGENADGGGAVSARPRIKLPKVDTSSLTAREHQSWSELVTELLSPCKDVAVPIAQCVKEKRACPTCLPAANFLLRLVQAGRPKKEAIAVFEARFPPDKIKTIVIGGSASKGPQDAPVTLVEFADFECGACGVASPWIDELYTKFAGKLRVVFKHFPLANHPNAKLAGQAAFAAQKQGQFWRLHKLMFANQTRLSEPDLVGYAEKIGLDVARFKRDMHSKDAKQRVEQEKQQGETLGVDATPSIYINGRICDLSKLGNPLRELEQWIELDIKLAGQKVPSSAPSSSSAKASASAPPTAPASASTTPSASVSP